MIIFIEPPEVQRIDQLKRRRVFLNDLAQRHLGPGWSQTSLPAFKTPQELAAERAKSVDAVSGYGIAALLAAMIKLDQWQESARQCPFAYHRGSRLQYKKIEGHPSPSPLADAGIPPPPPSSPPPPASTPVPALPPPFPPDKNDTGANAAAADVGGTAASGLPPGITPP
ncbi:hypothetical protein DFJ73DRAFT_902262 [Zopfochytrium polystomum]|nr:hypothetical protein DFJ73DRAFT_902262 [Zopfochytrium polystomum]